MTQNQIETTSKTGSVAIFEQEVPIRGCQFDLSSIKDAYVELSKVNTTLVQRLIHDLVRNPEMDDGEWDDYTNNLLEDASKLTVTIQGFLDEIVISEDETIFGSGALPDQIKSIYISNVTSFRRNANDVAPPNSVSVYLDFDKPDMFDPNPLVSVATSNGSFIHIKANEISFFRAVQRVTEARLVRRKTRYSTLHKNFIYDLGLWAVALPVSLILGTIYIDQFLPVGGELSSFRWPFFTYIVGLMLIIYRFLTSYAKWVFPVNVLSENKDVALKHRIGFLAVMSWLVYKIGDQIFELVTGLL